MTEVVVVVSISLGNDSLRLSYEVFLHYGYFAHSSMEPTKKSFHTNFLYSASSSIRRFHFLSDSFYSLSGQNMERAQAHMDQNGISTFLDDSMLSRRLFTSCRRITLVNDSLKERSVVIVDISSHSLSDLVSLSFSFDSEVSLTKCATSTLLKSYSRSSCFFVSMV